jgi:hypothetical protein
MSVEREQKHVQPCTLPVSNPRLEPEELGKHQGYIRVVCYACGVQYDRREIEEYSHPFAHHVSNFMCPKGHLDEARRLWKPVKGCGRGIALPWFCKRSK